jgi:prophage regulatory protein
MFNKRLKEGTDMTTYLHRLPAVVKMYSKSRSTIYAEIANGLFVPPVRLGPRVVAWLEREIEKVITARIEGRSDQDIRKLVIGLVEARNG